MLETAQALYKTGKYDISFICSPDKEFSDSLPEYIHYIPVKMKRGIDIGFRSMRRQRDKRMSVFEPKAKNTQYISISKDEALKYLDS